MAYNTPDEVTNRFRVLGEQYDDDEILDILDEANRKIAGRVGRLYHDVVRAQTNDQEEFDTTYDSLISFDSAWEVGYYENDEIDASNYTTDTSAGTITFDTSWAEDNVYVGKALLFYYVPTRFKDLELQYALRTLAQGSSLQTREGESVFSVSDINENIRRIENELNSRDMLWTVRDHTPGFHGLL